MNKLLPGDALMRHVDAYLRGVDPNLALVFREAMKRAGFPDISAALALENICADFLAGNRRWSYGEGLSPRPYAVLTDEKIAEQDMGAGGDA